MLLTKARDQWATTTSAYNGVKALAPHDSTGYVNVGTLTGYMRLGRVLVASRFGRRRRPLFCIVYLT